MKLGQCAWSVAVALVLSSLAACDDSKATGGGGGHTPSTSDSGGGGAGDPIAIDPQVFGKADLSGITFTAFSQTYNSGTDPMVLDLVPDLVPRNWSRWDRDGLKASDYNATYAADCAGKGISFVGGTTASVLFKDEGTDADFEAQVSRNAAGEAVPHDSIVPGAYRASLANASYRQRLIDIGKLQVDAGAIGIFYDEVNSSFQGAAYDGNEGFDDAHVADFGSYLCTKHASSLASWMTDKGITADDKLDCTGPSHGRSFDFRGYIARHGATNSPVGAQNPLAGDWGTTVQNRPDPAKGTFVETYPSLVYWQEIVLTLRTYAREKYSREILITSNGIFPFVDFQSVGLYDWNVEGSGPKGFDWVPLTAGGHLDGTVSFQATYQTLRARSKRIVEAAGGKEVPVLAFIDWPTDTINRYYALPLAERQDYFRIFMAEAYANGVWYAVPLRTTTDNNTATALGMMDFFKSLRAFYKGHADLYRGGTQRAETATVSVGNVSTSLVDLADGTAVLHVVNHAYDAGVKVQSGVTVSFTASAQPTAVKLVSADFAADKDAVFTYADGRVQVQVGDLGAYVGVVVK